MERTRVLASIVMFVCLLLGAGAGAAQAQVLPGVRLQGTLTDLTGQPLEGLVTFTVRIYDVAEGGTPLFTESFTETITNGALDIIIGIGLGTTTGDLLAALAPDGSGSFERFLALFVEGTLQELPRRRITAGAFALVAVRAESLGDLPASAYATSEQLRALRHELATVTAQVERICARIPPLCRR